jgi:6-phosphogluconolactonase
MATDLVTVGSEVFASTARDYIAGAIRKAAEGSRAVTVAFSGGRSPRPVYRQLAQVSDVPWERVAIYFADERAVAPQHPDSNYRLVKEELLDRISREVAAVHRMEAEQPDLHRAAREYETVLPIALDLLVLGLGEDGHTASLFPHHPAVAETHHRVVPVEEPGAPHRRMTITPPVIRAARSIIMLISGRNKAPALALALAKPDDVMECPARLARNGTWIADEQAADPR